MTRSATAIIVGGGIAGLSAGIALRRAGYGVTICERAPKIAAVGAALSLWPNAIEALRRIGAAERIEAEAAPITTMLLATQDGHPLIRREAQATAYLPTRSLLLSALAETLGDDVLLDSGVDAVSQDGGGVTVTLDGGQVLRADLAIAADGIWSPTATALIGNPPRPCGYGGVLALSDALDDPSSAEMIAEYQGDGERFGLCDLGDRRRYWFYMRDDPSGDLTLSGLAALARGWPPGIARAIAATPAERLIPCVISARPTPRRLGRGRIICVGDAAHAMEPNLGQGACQAIEDSVALGAVAARLPADAMLPAYEAMRLKRVRGFVRQSIRAGLGAHGSPFVRSAVRLGLRAIPGVIHDRVIAEMHRLPAYR